MIQNLLWVSSDDGSSRSWTIAKQITLFGSCMGDFIIGSEARLYDAKRGEGKVHFDYVFSVWKDPRDVSL